MRWQKVECGSRVALTERLRVPTGWLYSVRSSLGQQLCFVPEVETVEPSELEAQRDKAFGLAALRANRIGALEKELAALKKQLREMEVKVD